jgi:hypothetical protein
MPDMKSALQAALFRAPAHAVVQATIKEWDEQENQKEHSSMPSQTKPNAFRVSNNVMRETFNCIKNNPGLRNKEVCNLMAEKGFKKTSTSSIPSQLVNAGQAVCKDRKYYVLVEEYQPIKQTPTKKIQNLKKKMATLRKVVKTNSKGIVDIPLPTPDKEPVQGIAALPTQAPEQEPTMIVRRPMPSFEAKQMVNRWSAYQAREVYEELKTIFGA